MCSEKGQIHEQTAQCNQNARPFTQFKNLVWFQQRGLLPRQPLPHMPDKVLINMNSGVALGLWRLCISMCVLCAEGKPVGESEKLGQKQHRSCTWQSNVLALLHIYDPCSLNAFTLQKHLYWWNVRYAKCLKLCRDYLLTESLL